MTDYCHATQSQSVYSNFKKLPTSEDWFEVYEIASNLFAFCETRHYENTAISLIVGPEKAVLIDTGCGIGDLHKAVAEVTDKPVIVVNTHTHLDHLGSNRQFDEIAMFDHPISRRVALEGVSCLSSKWRRRSSVKISERTYEEGTEAFHSRRKSSHPEAASCGQSSRLGAV